MDLYIRSHEMNHQIDTESASEGRAARPRRPLLGLLVAQFLGAFNDNIYKMVLSLFAVQMAADAAAAGGLVPLIGAIFVLPFFLFSGYAGHLADVRGKHQVLMGTKGLEIVAMGLGCVAFLTGRIELMLGVLFLMALQSTLFGPAKYGILPELVPHDELSRVNGWVEMSTFLAIILGTTVGSVLFAAWKGHLTLVGLVLLGIALSTPSCWYILSPRPTHRSPLSLTPGVKLRRDSGGSTVRNQCG